jgi:hypothetical protein
MQNRRYQEEIWLASSTFASDGDLELEREPFCSSSFFSFGGNTMKDIDYIVQYPRRINHSRTTTKTKDQHDHRYRHSCRRRRRRRPCLIPLNTRNFVAQNGTGLSKLIYKNKTNGGGIITERKNSFHHNDAPSVTLSSVGSISMLSSIAAHQTCSSSMEFSMVTMVLLESDTEQGLEITINDFFIGFDENGENQSNCKESEGDEIEGNVARLGLYTGEQDKPEGHVDLRGFDQENNDETRLCSAAGQTTSFEEETHNNDTKVIDEVIDDQQLRTDDHVSEQLPDALLCAAIVPATDHQFPTVTPKHDSVPLPYVVSSINSQHKDYKSLDSSSQASNGIVAATTLCEVAAVGTIMNTFPDYRKTIEEVKQKIIKEQTEAATLEAELKHFEKEYQETLKELTDYLGVIEKQKLAMECKNAKIRQALSELKSTKSQLVEYMSSK